MRLILALLALLLPASAWAQCAGGLLSNCPAAVDLLPTDLVYGWQNGQVPHSRAMTVLQLGNAASTANFASPPPIGNVVPNTGAFTNLTASGSVTGATGAFTNLTVTGTISGAGITANFASPPPIGNVAPNTGAFTTGVFSGNVDLTGTGELSLPSGTTGQQPNTGNAGSLRWNTTTGRFEVGIGGAWKNFVRLDGDTMTGALDNASTVRGQTGLLAGTNSIVGLVTVNGAAGQQRSMVFDTAGVQRMRIGIDNTAESGSNAGSVPFINVATDAGAATRAWSVDRNTTQSLMPRLKLGQSFVYAGGAANNDTAALNISANYSGSTDGAAWVNLNGMTINSDTLNPGANQQAIGFNIAHNVGGAGIGGNRTALRVQITSIGAFPSNSIFQGVLSSVTMQHSSGGSDVWENAAGVVFGGGTYGQLFSGATNWRGVVGHEIDYGIYAGATAAGITGFQIVRWANHAYSPPNPEGDNVLVLGSQGATNGAKTAIQIGSYNGYTGIDPTGKIMDVVMSVLGDHTFPMGHGLDLKLPTFAATAFRSKGFSVLGDGSVQVGTAYLSSDASGSSLDAKGSYVSAAAVATGGVNLHTNEMLIDDVTGTVLSITATDNGSGPGAVTAVGIYRVGYSLSPPANPVTFRVVGYALGNGMGQPTAPTITLTWTAQNALSINPSGGNTVVGTGAALATNATSGFLQIPTMAGAPSGTVGAAGQAALVYDSTNKKLCVSIGGGTWECTVALLP